MHQTFAKKEDKNIFLCKVLIFVENCFKKEKIQTNDEKK